MSNDNTKTKPVINVAPEPTSESAQIEAVVKESKRAKAKRLWTEHKGATIAVVAGVVLTGVAYAAGKQTSDATVLVLEPSEEFDGDVVAGEVENVNDNIA